ncbi:hypothetical protein A1D29_07500 [Pasteurellaceae bacterium Orientalotternb1]|nr:hypothetical protein A1D29_07500 [Pasteurellaceae bacterium Orientalotternb1]
MVMSIRLAIGLAAFGLLFYWRKKRNKAKSSTMQQQEGNVAGYGVQVFDENGRLQATLTEREMSVVHYHLYYPKGTGKRRDMKYLAQLVRQYPGYLASGGSNIDGAGTWTWDGGSTGYEVNPQQPVVMGEEWYAMSAVAEASSNPFIRPWSMPGSACIYDKKANKFICRADNAHISGLLITVGSK